MVRQARIISSWGDNVYVKIPVTNTQGYSMAQPVRNLSEDGVKVNVTAIFTDEQVEIMAECVERRCAIEPLHIRRSDRRCRG